MGWIRETDDTPDRRPTDVVKLIAAASGAVVVGVWAQSQSAVDIDLFRVVNQSADNFNGAARAAYALGSIWFVIGVAAVVLLLKHTRIAAQVAVAGAASWGIALLLNDLLGTHSISGLSVDVRYGDGPTYPAANVAVITAIVLALSPFGVRALRRIGFLLIIAVAFASLYLGVAYPSDVLGGVLLGIAVVAAIRVAVGSPGGKPTLAEVRDALTDLDFDVAAVTRSGLTITRATVADVLLTSGEPLRVEAFGRDQRDGQIASKMWHWLVFREPGLTVFGSRLQQVEHIGYVLMLAERAGLCTPKLVRTGIGGADAALLITEPPPGTPLSDVEDDLTDEQLAAIWTTVDGLHRAGISHGHLTPDRILVGSNGVAALDELSASDATGNPYWINRDNAAVVVETARRVGNERAVQAVIDALGKERAGEIVPVVQPAALPTHAVRSEKHLGKTLKSLRTDLAGAAGVEDVAPLKIRRLDWANIGMLIGVVVALAIAIPSLAGMNWQSVRSEFENATWGWALLAFVLYPLVPMAWATALMGCVNADLPFVPTALTQLACSFLNLITPNGIGGTALQIDYLHKQGIPVASGGSAMVLSTGVGGAIQMILFLIGAAVTSTAIETSSSSDSSGSTTLIAIAVIAALIGIVLMVPKIRGKVVPAVKRAATDIWAVVRNPRKATQLIGGDTAGNLLYPALLGLCLLAFNQHLDYAQLVVVQIGAGMLGNVAPVPGGIGVQEAALTGGLTAFGIASAPALAAVIVFRAITFAIPPIFGFFTLRWLRRQGYA
jgi:uncharacterized membrane protein YbhN (UPF0104 family)/membrane-associated phospholipid phosphatase